MGVLGSLFGGIYYAVSGPSKAATANNTPPINAGSSDEADFITCANSIQDGRYMIADEKQKVPQGAGQRQEELSDHVTRGKSWVSCTTRCTYSWRLDVVLMNRALPCEGVLSKYQLFANVTDKLS